MKGIATTKDCSVKCSVIHNCLILTYEGLVIFRFALYHLNRFYWFEQAFVNFPNLIYIAIIMFIFKLLLRT